MCFPSSDFAVTFRATYYGQMNTTSMEFLEYLSEWVSSGPSIIYQDSHLRVDSECPVLIESDVVCTIDREASYGGAIAGGVLSIVILVGITIVGIFVTVILISRLCQNKKRPP